MGHWGKTKTFHGEGGGGREDYQMYVHMLPPLQFKCNSRFINWVRATDFNANMDVVPA